MTAAISGNFHAVDGLLAAVADQAKDLRPAWDDFGHKVWKPRQDKHFATSAFVPLSARYSRRKFMSVGAAPILVRSGALRDAATKAKPTNADAHFAVFGPKIRGRQDLFYGAVHQKGTTKYPKRPVVKKLTKAERSRLHEIIADHLLEPAA